MGTVSVSGNVITGSPAEGCGYDAPAWTVLSGTAQVEKKGDTFTVYAEEDCTVQINFRRRSQTVDVWDGSVADSVPVSGNVYMIGTCAQLAKLAQMVNGGEKLAGKTVQLTNDLDLNGHQWTPIGSGAGFCFSGSFGFSLLGHRGFTFAIFQALAGTDAFDNVFDSFRKLCTNALPVINAIEFDFFLFAAGIVKTQLFDCSSVTGGTLIHHHNPETNCVTGSGTFQSDSYHRTFYLFIILFFIFSFTSIGINAGNSYVISRLHQYGTPG